MSNYFLLERIKVENANSIAGVTYGFPAITNFLGFTHSLSRKMKERFGIEFSGCGIVCHSHKLDTHKLYDVRFIQTKTSPSALIGKQLDASKTPPIIEEGKMDMEVSILLKCEGDVSTNDYVVQEYKTYLKQWIYSSRLAGGTIFSCKSLDIYSDSGFMRLKKKLLPGFVLLDRNDLLKQDHTRDHFDVWTDFFAYKAKAEKKDIEGKAQVEWVRIDKPSKGWIVPLMVGYKGISSLYDPSEVDNLRDIRYPFRFVESVHGLGEWKAIHKLDSLNEAIWQYWVKDEWYLCHQDSINNVASDDLDTDFSDDFNNLD